MTQAPVLSASGMYTRFSTTRVLYLQDLLNGKLLRCFDTLQPGAVFDNLALAVVDRSQSKNGGQVKQVKVLKAVLVSHTQYAALKLANPLIVPSMKEFIVADDFLLPEDRFARTVVRTNPVQTRITNSYILDGAGVATTGIQFEDATLEVLHPALTPSAVDGTAGTFTFTVGDAGKEVKVIFVTKAINPVFLINRLEATAKPALVVKNETLAVLLSPTLAALLAVPLPAF